MLGRRESGVATEALEKAPSVCRPADRRGEIRGKMALCNLSRVFRFGDTSRNWVIL